MEGGCRPPSSCTSRLARDSGTTDGGRYPPSKSRRPCRHFLPRFPRTRIPASFSQKGSGRGRQLAENVKASELHPRRTSPTVPPSSNRAGVPQTPAGYQQRVGENLSITCRAPVGGRGVVDTGPARAAGAGPGDVRACRPAQRAYPQVFPPGPGRLFSINSLGNIGFFEVSRSYPHSGVDPSKMTKVELSLPFSQRRETDLSEEEEEA